MTGAQLRAWRIEHKLRQLDMCNLLGVAEFTYQRWEHGTHKIPPFLSLALERLDQLLKANAIRT